MTDREYPAKEAKIKQMELNSFYCKR